MVSCLSAVKLFDPLKLTEALNSQAQVPVYSYHASVSQFSHLVMSDSLQLHGLQHSRPPCSSPTPRACPNSCPLESVMPSNHLILCCPLLLLPSVLPGIGVFSSELILCIRWPKYWSFSFSISHSNEYSGLISFRTDWLDLLTVQGALKSLLQHHSSEESILQYSAFFMVQLAHPYMTIRNAIGHNKKSVKFLQNEICLYSCMSYKYLLWIRDHTLSHVFTTRKFIIVVFCKPGEHWWNSSVTQGVPDLLVEWMWGSDMWLWFLSCATIWIFQESHMKDFWHYSTR